MDINRRRRWSSQCSIGLDAGIQRESMCIPSHPVLNMVAFIMYHISDRSVMYHMTNIWRIT